MEMKGQLNVHFESYVYPLNVQAILAYSGVPRNFVRGGQQIQLRRGQRERGSGGGSSLVSGFGGSCNLVQEIPFQIVKCS